jgi:DeoR/GlpR family transcriptional regulator of sugar metabolism
MLKEERFSQIFALIKNKGKTNDESLAGELNVSADTIRRDIESLHNNGLLLKVRGGAISLSKNPLSFQDRIQHRLEEKNIIALKALQLIREGQTVFADGGSLPAALFVRALLLLLIRGCLPG